MSQPPPFGLMAEFTEAEPMTEAVRRARAAGCLTVDGGGRAVGQAVEAFSLFTGVPASQSRMYAHLREMVGG